MRSFLAGSVMLLVAGLAPCPAGASVAPEAAPGRSKMLITAAQLARELKNPKLVILQVGPESEYQAGHIPGARFLKMDALERGGAGLALELPETTRIDSVLGSLGVGPDSRIVLYFGKDWVSPTTRVWFTLDYAGLGGQTALLDGGFPAWKAANLPVSTEVPPPAAPRQLRSTAHKEFVAQGEWIKSRLNDPRLQIIDARSSEFYRGLENGGNGRAGHVAGARNLVFTWVTGDSLRFLPDSALRRLFTEAGYAPGKDLVTYCHIGQQGTAVYFAAKLLGLPVRMYDGSFEDWSAHKDYPVEGNIPFTEGALISTEALAGLIEKNEVSVVDVRSDFNAYLANHIPGAPFLHFESLRATGKGVPGDTLSSAAYATLLGKLGVRRDRPVVIYGSGDANNFNATFLAWILTGFRHPKVYLLDGGYTKWAAENRPLTRKYPEPALVSYSADPYALEVANTGWVRYVATHPSKDAVLVDVRPADQFAGTAGAQARRGHIPTAINHTWSDDLKDAGNGVKVWKSVAELKAAYERQGITPDKQVFLYCNTGTEASHTYFALRHLLGYPSVRVYVPSWTAWSGQDDLPVETGTSAAATGR